MKYWVKIHLGGAQTEVLPIDGVVQIKDGYLFIEGEETLSQPRLVAAFPPGAWLAVWERMDIVGPIYGLGVQSIGDEIAAGGPEAIS